MIQLKFRSHFVTQGSKLCLQGYTAYHRSRSYCIYPAASVRHKRGAVLTLHAMTPFKELYLYTQQPCRLPNQSDAVLADLFSTSLLTGEESKPFPKSQRTNPYTGVGSLSPACTLLKGGQIHTVPAQFPQTVKVIMHRKHYLEPKRRYVVGAGGFSSPSTEKRSRNPVSERGTIRNALFSAEDKSSIESSPLKGCAAQPCLPGKTSRQAAAKGACTPEVELPSPSGYTGHL